MSGARWRSRCPARGWCGCSPRSPVRASVVDPDIGKRCSRGVRGGRPVNAMGGLLSQWWDASRVLARGLLVLAVLIDPEMVVTRGGIGSNPYFLEPVRSRSTVWLHGPSVSRRPRSARSRLRLIGAVHHALASLPQIESHRVSARMQDRRDAAIRSIGVPFPLRRTRQHGGRSPSPSRAYTVCFDDPAVVRARGSTLPPPSRSVAVG